MGLPQEPGEGLPNLMSTRPTNTRSRYLPPWPSRSWTPFAGGTLSRHISLHGHAEEGLSRGATTQASARIAANAVT